MKKETLYRYFEGIASREEEEAVYRWLDVSPANEEELLREREFFDAMILVGNEEAKTGTFFRAGDVKGGSNSCYNTCLWGVLPFG